MGNFVSIWNDSYLYKKEYIHKLHGAETPCFELVLLAHGVMGLAIIDSRFHNASSLTQIITRNVSDLYSYKYIRLACCRSATPLNGSLAYYLSLCFPEHYIKGYVDTIYTCCQPHAVNRSVDEIGLVRAGAETSDFLLEYKLVTIDENFHSVIYRQGSIVAQKMSSPEGILRMRNDI